MTDDKSKKDFRDRNRVSINEDFEVRVIADKMGVSRREVIDAAGKVGSDRKKIEEYLDKNKKRR